MTSTIPSTNTTRLSTSIRSLEKEIAKLGARCTPRTPPTRKRITEAQQAASDMLYCEKIVGRLRAIVHATETNTLPPTLWRLNWTRALVEEINRYDHLPSPESQSVLYPALVDAALYHGEVYTAIKSTLFALHDPNEPSSDPLRELGIRIAKAQTAGYRGYFRSPKAIVDLLLDAAEINHGDAVLEPAAGDGAILDGIKERFSPSDIACLHFAEIVPELYSICEDKDFTPQPRIGHDFMVPGPWDQDWRYNVIVGNPPFENNQDTRFIMKAYDWLAVGGRMVMICSEHPFFASRDREALTFLAWLSSVGGITEKLPAESFKESGTGVAARIVVIDKE